MAFSATPPNPISLVTKIMCRHFARNSSNCSFMAARALAESSPHSKNQFVAQRVTQSNSTVSSLPSDTDATSSGASCVVLYGPRRSLCISTRRRNSSSHTRAVAMYTGLGERDRAISSANWLLPERWPPVIIIISAIVMKHPLVIAEALMKIMKKLCNKP